MQVTEVKVRKLENSMQRAIGIASVVLDNEININDIKIVKSIIDGELFIMMPSKKLPNGEFKDIAHPINVEAREKITKAIIEEYNKI